MAETETVLQHVRTDGRTIIQGRVVSDKMEKTILACGVDLRGSQPTGDNMAGGLSTIEEKSIGAYAKSGTRPIVGMLRPGVLPPRPGVARR